MYDYTVGPVLIREHVWLTAFNTVLKKASCNEASIGWASTIADKALKEFDTRFTPEPEELPPQEKA